MATFNWDRLHREPRVRNTRGFSAVSPRYYRASLPLDSTRLTAPVFSRLDRYYEQTSENPRPAGRRR